MSLKRLKTLFGWSWAPTSEVSSKLTRQPSDLKQLNDSVWQYFEPPPDSDGVPKMEILFFHGAQLSPGTEAFWKTWLSRDETVVWPMAWLAQKFPEARMLFVSYDSSIQRSSGQKDTCQTIENLMHDIIWSSTCSAGQKCPMIFVGHCFGGIIIKEFLIRCSEYPATNHSEDLDVQKLRVFLQHCRAVFYYSTPNAGSRLMDGLAYRDFILGNVNKSTVRFLKVLSKDTARINNTFNNLRRNQKWQTRGIGETLETNLKDSTKTMVVPEASARQDLDRIYWAPDADHFDVSRAKDYSACSIFTGLSDLVGDYYHIASSSIRADSKSRSALLISNDKHHRLRNSSFVDVTKMTTSPLPFGQDKNYVPLVRTFDRVRLALESEHDNHVVTICGEPGLGKTSLAKYIALHYWPHHTPHGSGERSSAFFPDGVFFLHCGQGAVHRIKQLQKQLLQILGGELQLEAVPADIPEERDGDHVAIPTFRRRFQFKLRDLKALIILDDVWERQVLEELILSPDEAGSVKYLVTSQIMDIWPHAYATSILMKKPTYEEARAILLKYTKGLSAQTGFPENIKGTVDSIIRLLDFHPLTLANFGLGFREHEGRDPEAWRRLYNSLKYELPVTESYGPLIYGREYPFALDMSMTRIISSLQGLEQDLIFLVSGLSNSGVPETVIRYFYKWAKIGNMSRFRYGINNLQNRSLVDVHSYPYGSEVVIHKLRALSIISQFPREVQRLMRRAIQPLRDSYSYRTAQRTAIGSGHCDAVDANDGLLSAAMLGMYTNKRFLGDVKMEMPSSVDFDVDDMLKTAGEEAFSLRYMVQLLQPDSGGERWEQEAAICARKIIVKFICQHELDDESVACLIQLPKTTSTVLDFLEAILYSGYWWRPFFQDNKVFSTTHSEIVRSLSVLVHDNATSHAILYELVDFLFGRYTWSMGLLDYEDDNTIVNIGERLMKLAVGENAEDSFEWVPIQRFPCSSSRAFRVLEEKSPHLRKAMLTLFIQETIRLEWFSKQPSRNNVDNWELLERLCRSCHSPGLSYYNLGEPFPTLAWLSQSPENRGALSASPEIMTSILSTLVHFGEIVLPDKDILERCRDCVRFVRSLMLSPEIRQKILSMYPQVLEALERVEKNYLQSLEKGIGIFDWDEELLAVSDAIGLLHSTAVHIKISEYKPHISDERYDYIIRGRLKACYDMKMYEEFLAITEEDIFPRRLKEKLLVEIITAKVMLKWYPSALVDATNLLLLHQPPSRHIGGLGRAWSLQGMVLLLSCKNLEQALTDFEESLPLLKELRKALKMHPPIASTVLLGIYDILKYRGFTKYLMGDIEGAKEDATEAQRIELRSLVWDFSSTDYGPLWYKWFKFDRCLFRQPLTYLGFNFTL